jgi:hypothetical protein
MEERQLRLEEGVMAAVGDALRDAVERHLPAVRVGNMNYVLRWRGEKLTGFQSRVIIPSRTAGQGGSETAP